MDDTVNTESNQNWVVAGIPVRTPLKPISIKPKEKRDDVDECPKTPTAEDTRTPRRITECPPAPRKPKAISRCQFDGFKDFFIPPDLDSVFIRSIQKA